MAKAKKPAGDWQADYEARVNDATGHLHNHMVAYISEAKIPLPQILLVLNMLWMETMEQCRKQYLPGG